MNIAAIVLAGGRARRMGTPKHAVRLGCRTLLDRVLDAVVPFPTVVVGPPALASAVSAHPDASLTRERLAFSGPVAGIDAALDHLQRRGVPAGHALILSCDLARPAEAIDLLLSSPVPVGDGLVLRDAEDRMQWLCGLYGLRPVHAAMDRLRSTSLDSVRVSALFAGLSVTAVDDAGSLSFDIDTPADLVAASGLIRSYSGSGPS